jgi:anti-sigma factor RsiW
MSRPTDLELMAYFDGELDEPRRSEIARWLEGDAAEHEARAAHQKLAGLALGAEWVQAAEPRATEADASAVDSILAAVRADQERPSPSVDSRGPANDNQRWTVGFLGLLSAAAAAVFLWPRTPAPTAGGASAGSSGSVTTTAAASVVVGAASASSVVDAVAEADDDLQGVQVATIDFGTRTGAIYNVVSDVLQDGGAGAEKHVATTVVWITDP